MRIALYTHLLNQFYGVFAWTFDIANELKNRGYEVDIYCAKSGRATRYLKNNGFNVYKCNKQINYEIALVNFAFYKELFSANRIILTIHGVNGLKYYHKSNREFNKVVTVSQWLKDIAEKPVDYVIENGFNLSKYNITSIPKNNQILMITRYKSLPIQWEKDLIGNTWELKIIGHSSTGSNVKLEDVINEIQKSKVVVAVGRGAVEGYLMGRPVFLHGVDDRWRGRLTTENFYENNYDNFSCRSKCLTLPNSYLDVLSEIDFEKENFQPDSEICRYVDIKTKVDMYENLIDSI